MLYLPSKGNAPLNRGRLLRVIDYGMVAAVILVVCLMFNAQFILTAQPSNPEIDVHMRFMAGAAVLVGLYCLWRGRFTNSDSFPAAAPPIPPRIRIRWLVIAVLYAGFTTLLTIAYETDLVIWVPLAAWAVSMFALIRAVAGRKVPSVSPELALRRWEFWLLIVLFAVALLVRAYNLDSMPYVLDQDEARFALYGVGHRKAGFKISPFIPGDHTHPNINYIMAGLPTLVLGQTAATPRVVSVIAGAFSIVVIYLIGRELMGWSCGLVSALFALTWTLHILFSRLALNQSADALFVTLPFYFILRGWRRGAAVDFALSGITLAVAQLFYAGGRVAPLIMVAFLLWMLLRQPRSFVRRWRLLAVGLLAMLLTALPQHFYLFYYRKPLTDRGNPNIFIGGNFQSAVASGADPVDFLMYGIRTSFYGLFTYWDSGGWYGAGSNLMGPFGGPPLLVGCVVILFMFLTRPRYGRWALLLGWPFSVILLISAFSSYPPQYQRIFPAGSALAVLVGIGVIALARGVAGALRRPDVREPLAVMFGLVLATANFAYFIGVYVPAGKYVANRLNHATNQVAHDMVAHYNAGEQVIVIAGFNTGIENTGVIKYFMTDKPYVIIEDARPIPQQENSPIKLVNPALPFAFFVAPTREADLDYIRERFPGGHVRTVKLKLDDSITYYLYERDTGYIPKIRESSLPRCCATFL